MKRLRGHPELGRRLIWLDSISDEFLDLVYAGCQCLIAASEGEGFGLPLIEAAQHGIPIIARDIPVFRGSCCRQCFLFEASEPAQMADAVKEWIGLNARNLAPQSSGMSWLTWEESAFMLVQKVEHFQ
ncbi:MAG: glycosyltransferase [Betaproteobacteria bacterium]|nr:glycosyltransferase [Betaproteobacteria bacterium]